MRAVQILSFLLLIAALSGLLWVRTQAQSKAYFLEGEEKYAARQYHEAAVAYETAIHMYTPWNPYVRESVERLWEIGQIFENQKDCTRALDTYRSLRSSLYAIQSFYKPYVSWIEKSEERIRFCQSPVVYPPVNADVRR